MATSKYIALLRGINVGGNHLIKMTNLVGYFEKMGFQKVRTYIQSGNVLFRTTQTSPVTLAHNVEAALAEAVGYHSVVVVKSAAELELIVKSAPRDFGADPTTYRYNVIFLRDPLTSTEALPHFSAREGVDQVTPGPGVIYFSNLMAEATKSRLSRIVGSPIYKDITIRNWNTTTKLLALATADD